MLTIARMLMAWLPLYSTTNYDNKLLIKEEVCECFEMEKWEFRKIKRRNTWMRWMGVSYMKCRVVELVPLWLGDVGRYPSCHN